MNITLQLSSERDLVIGEILNMHTRNNLIDPETLHLNLNEYEIVGRLYADLYAPLREIFSIRRYTPDEWFGKKVNQFIFQKSGLKPPTSVGKDPTVRRWRSKPLNPSTLVGGGSV